MSFPIQRSELSTIALASIRTISQMPPHVGPPRPVVPGNTQALKISCAARVDQKHGLHPLPISGPVCSAARTQSVNHHGPSLSAAQISKCPWRSLLKKLLRVSPPISL